MDLPNHFQNLHALLESVNSWDDFYILAILWQLLTVTFMGTARNRGGGGISVLTQGHANTGQWRCVCRDSICPMCWNWRERDCSVLLFRGSDCACQAAPRRHNCFKSHSALGDKTDFTLGYQPTGLFFLFLLRQCLTGRKKNVILDCIVAFLAV